MVKMCALAINQSHCMHCKTHSKWRYAWGFLGLFYSLLACSQSPATVVVYASADQEYAEQILQEMQASLKLKVNAVFDAEASKTVGLERRLEAEKNRPKADIFWNSEFLRTYRLQKQGALDKDHTVSFGLRARVLAVNTDLVEKGDFPQQLEALVDPKWRGKVAMATPLFGTTATHFAALHTQWGEARFVEFLHALKRNQVMLLPGNGEVRNAVVAGRAAIGLTDTDDAVGAMRRGQPLAMVFPDQDSVGAFAVHMTATQVAGRQAMAQTQQVLDFLANEATEQRLIALGAVQFSHRAGGPMAAEIGPQRPKLWQMEARQIDASLATSVALIRKHLL
jgi:iron(III) transport system substrate-binding protein